MRSNWSNLSKHMLGGQVSMCKLKSLPTQHTGAPTLNDNDDPYPIYDEEEVESDDED